MVQLILTNEDIKTSVVKPVHELEINDFNLVNIHVLGFVTDVLYIEENTYITHTIK